MAEKMCMLEDYVARRLEWGTKHNNLTNIILSFQASFAVTKLSSWWQMKDFNITYTKQSY